MQGFVKKEGEFYDPRTYWEKRLSRSFSLAGVGFLGLGEGFNYWLYKIRKSVFLRALKRIGLLNADLCSKRVLDVGVGTGFYVGLWHNLWVRQLTGIDITDVAVYKVKQEYPQFEFFRADISACELPISGPFDIVSAMDVLFHIVDDSAFERAIHNISYLTSPGGYVFLTDLFLQAGEFSCFHQKSRSYHTYKNLLKSVGLQEIVRLPIFVLMHPPRDASGVWGFALRVWWRVLEKGLTAANSLRLQNFFGFLVGMALYPLELLLLSVVREGPSTELLICRKER